MIGHKIINFKRATMIVALFFHSTGLLASGKTETYKDLIEKSYNLSIQKDRTQAYITLANAIKKESKKGQVPKELLVAAEEVSSVFYSDKAQQLFETAISLKNTDLTLANTKISEAQKIEPDNLLILLEQLRMQLTAGECSSVFKKSGQNLETYFFYEPLKLIQAQAAVCSGEFSYYIENKPSDFKKSSLQLFWQQVEIEYLFKTSEFQTALVLAQNSEAQFSTFPETYYWRWKLELELKLKAEKSATKYLTSCKKISPRQQREFSVDPFLCRHTAEVENFLKKNNNR